MVLLYFCLHSATLAGPCSFGVSSPIHILQLTHHIDVVLYPDLCSICCIFQTTHMTFTTMYVCSGMYGQLGHGNTEKQSAPKLVTELEGVTVYVLSCGNFHTVSAAIMTCMHVKYCIYMYMCIIHTCSYVHTFIK